MDIVEIGWIGTVIDIPILQFKTEYRLAAFPHSDVTHEDILHFSTSFGIGLYADDAVEVGTVHGAVLHPHIAHAACDFAAHSHAGVSVLHRAVTHYYVFARDIPAATILVTTRFYSDAVIAGVKVAAVNKHIAA